MSASPPARPAPGRFEVLYRIAAPSRAEAAARARAVALEQTVEFPEGLVPPGFIRDQVVGRLEGIERAGDAYLARLSFLTACAGGELTQLLNLLFGNSSLQPGLRLEALCPGPGLRRFLPGPRFGLPGLRRATGVKARPLLSTALKPMGLSAAALAERAYQFALGGVDLIKDDHGLADQGWAPFGERVRRCAAAVRRANRETGRRSLYLPNVTAGPAETIRRARLARRAGAGGLLVAPGLCGFATLQALAADPAVGLPLLAHPALLGSFTVSRSAGMAHRVLYGQLLRLSGADASIFPHWGGRFAFSREECLAIAAGCREPFGGWRPILPVPAGGMSLQRVPELLECYGQEAVFLVGGGLFADGPDLAGTARRFLRLVGGHA